MTFRKEMHGQDKDKTKGRKESEFGDEPQFMSEVTPGTCKNQEEVRQVGGPGEERKGALGCVPEKNF